MKSIPAKYRDWIISSISTDTPLAIAAPLIPDEAYWERRSKAKFRLANVNEFGGSWKRLFFELHVRDCIEEFQPTLDDAMYDSTTLEEPMKSIDVVGEKLKSLEHTLDYATSEKLRNFEKLRNLVTEVQLGAPFIQSLHLRQLKPIEPRAPFNSQNAEQLQDKSDLQNLMKDVSSDHLHLSLVLSNLTNLKTFSAYFGYSINNDRLRDCGINFRWNYFGMTINDGLKLASAIETSTITSLSLPASGIDDDRCRVLCHSILKNKTLRILDLSNNKIKDPGAKALASLLASPTSTLLTLKLSNNKIGSESGLSFGKALVVNSSLSNLDLRLGHLGDEGGHHLLSHLKRNNALESLDLSGNGLGKKSITSLGALLKRNGSKLTRLDMSCNKLGTYTPNAAEGEVGVISALIAQASPDAAGKILLEAISLNKVNSISLST